MKTKLNALCGRIGDAPLPRECGGDGGGRIGDAPLPRERDGGDAAERLSRKVVRLSFLAMVCVVYIHHKSVGADGGAAAWNAVAQTFLTRSLTDWAVPFFFLMSGFWFARSGYVASAPGGGYIALLRKKARTLLVPYLLWAVIGAFLVMPVIVFNNRVNHCPLLSRTFLGAGSSWGCADALLGLTRNGPLGNLALWYVRTLLVFFLAAPVWRRLFRASRALTLGIGLCLVLFAPEAWIPHTGLKAGSFGWLLCGMGLSSAIAADARLPPWGAALCGAAWIGLGLAKAFGVALLPQLIPVFAIPCLWSLADGSRPVRGWMRPTFWVYCLHGALAGYTLAGPLFLFGKGDAATFLITLVMPWANVAACLAAARLVRRRLPRLYAALTGGRGGAERTAAAKGGGDDPCAGPFSAEAAARKVASLCGGERGEGRGEMRPQAF